MAAFFTSLPAGRDQSEEAGCGIPFFRSLLVFQFAGTFLEDIL
jgi:hypothetical protein